jgi:protein O-GlcNAc transferase
MQLIAEMFEVAVRSHQGGDLSRAEQLYRQILQADCAHDGALHLLGVLAYQAGHHADAIALLKQAIALKPSVANYQYHLGIVFKDQGFLPDALACFQRAVQCDPNHAAAQSTSGIILQRLGRFDEAVECFRQALRLNPRQASMLSNMGIAFEGLGRPDEAMDCYREALHIDPAHVNAHINLGLAHFGQAELDVASECFRHALTVDPNHADAHNNLGLVLKLQGNLTEATACHRRALALKPDFAAAHSDLLYTMIFGPDQNPETIFAEHLRWNRMHAVPLTKFFRPHDNDKNPERRLRIGYVSPDFREHPVGRFLLPLLEAHDHANFEIFCYASVPIPDRFTDQCRSHADVWRNVSGMSDENLADIIRQDRIDILVDLSLHTGGNRLLLFARKPAPVQVTYLAYCGTTGLKTIDYRLTDPFLDPDDRNERFYSEQSIRLAETFWCYQPATETLENTPLPSSQLGQITFGCLNNFSKVTAPTLETWSRILRQMPPARLLLYVPVGSARARLQEFFSQRDIEANRLEFVAKVPMADYFQTYGRIDIALDPFPYGGGTTTCDALWMGVPVVCLAGETAVGRGGVSILTNIGLSELIAQDTDAYVRIAVALAEDRTRLISLRASLRARMRNSPLMDAPRFARHVEVAYRAMWRAWCAKV